MLVSESWLESGFRTEDVLRRELESPLGSYSSINIPRKLCNATYDCSTGDEGYVMLFFDPLVSLLTLSTPSTASSALASRQFHGRLPNFTSQWVPIKTAMAMILRCMAVLMVSPTSRVFPKTSSFDPAPRTLERALTVQAAASTRSRPRAW